MHLETEGRGAGRQVLRDHVPEMVGWLAASRNHGSLGQVTYDAGITPSEVHETPYEFPFAGSFRFPPKLFGSIGTYHGSDSAQLRQTRPATTMSFEVMIEEEQCTGETEGGFTHPWAEEVDYFAISAGIEGRANGLGYDFTEFSAHYGLSESHGRIKASQLAHVGRSSSNHRAVGESGDLTIMDEWITVQLKGYYFKPVIIAGPPTYHGTHAVVARIRNLRHGHDCPGWCFDVRLQEPPCMDQVHPNPEGMNWLVIESGAWVTDARTSRRSEWSSSSDRGEQTIQASVTEIEGDMRLTGEMFHRVNFLGNGFSRLPVVLSQVMSNYVSANSSLSALSKPKPRCTGGQLRQDASAAGRFDALPGDAGGGWLGALEWRRR